MLCVTAHPDDECFAFGGALVLAAERGIETSVVCFTDGKAASNRGAAKTGAELGAMRREEFAAACKLLGVTHTEMLPYEDGQLEYANFHQAAGLLVEWMRRWKPDVVLTFGLDGAQNAHADHTMVSCFTSAAFRWAARPGRYPEQLEHGLESHTAKRLYHQTTDFVLTDRPTLLPSPWTVALDVSGVLERKLAAFALHTSQAALLDKNRPMFKKHGQTEHYVLSGVQEPQAAVVGMDLFTGL